MTASGGPAAPPGEHTPLVGRWSEQQLLSSVVDAAMAGHGRAALINGEPGMGRSAVLRAAATHSDVRVLYAVCTPDQRHHPFAALVNALGTELADGSIAPADVLARLSAQGPYVLAIDDAHWADPSSLGLLRDLADTLDDVPLALLLTARSYEVPAALTGLLTRLSCKGVLTTLVLTPLDRASVAALAAELIGSVPGPGLLADLDLAGGNPLHVIDLVESHARASVRVGEPTPEPHEVEPPPGRDVRRELGSLSAGTYGLLTVAALLGSGFSVRELCEVLGRPITELLPAVREALDADVLCDDGPRGLRFRADEVRTAVSDELPAGVRAELHREIAHTLDRAGASISVIGRHLVHSSLQPSDLDWVQRIAADLLPLDPELAARLWACLDASVPDPDSRRAAVAVGLAQTHLALVDPSGAELAARRGLTGGARPGLAGELRLALSTSLLWQGRWALARASAESAAGALELFPAERAEQVAIAATSSLLSGDLAAATEAVERVDAAVALTGAPRARRRALAVRGRLAHLAGDLPPAERLLREARQEAEVDGSWPADDLIVTTWHALVLADLDRMAEAMALLADPAGPGGPTRTPLVSVVGARAARAGLQLEAGSIAEAAETLDAVIAELDELGVTPNAALLGRRALAALHLGGPEASAPWVARMSWTSRSGRAGLGWVHRALAAQLAAERDDDGERHALEEGWDHCLEHGLSLDLVVLGPSVAAVAAARGDRTRIEQVVGVLDRLASANGDVVTLRAAADTARGLAAQDPDTLVAAVRLWKLSPRRLEAARIGERIAKALRGLGRSALANQVTTQMVGDYAAAGAVHDAERAKQTLTGSRTSPGRPPKPAKGRAALTRTERVVAQYVEQGESNTEIAERMVLSRRTVESHVSHILAKLGMRSRADLILAAARRAGLPPNGAEHQA